MFINVYNYILIYHVVHHQIIYNNAPNYESYMNTWAWNKFQWQWGEG
jgi:hypothetical protein